MDSATLTGLFLVEMAWRARGMELRRLACECFAVTQANRGHTSSYTLKTICYVHAYGNVEGEINSPEARGGDERFPRKSLRLGVSLMRCEWRGQSWLKRQD